MGCLKMVDKKRVMMTAKREEGMTPSTRGSFDFWNDHSLEFLEMALKRDFQEKVHCSDGYGRAVRECGDTIEFFLMAQDHCLVAISYDVKGCLFSHACANTLIHLAMNRSIEEAGQIREEDVIGFLKTLPGKERHCATLALKAFSLALESLSR